MSTMKITDQGRAIIANSFSGSSSGAKYWIGYYGLAYVDKEKEPLDEVTTRLTNDGDYIYNIWQGDLTGTGFADDDTSGAKSLFGLTMYEKNICSNYRYVMDEDGNNNLVVWSSSGTSGAENVGTRESYQVYHGYDASKSTPTSEIPVPAPLFYYNDPLGASDTLSNPGSIDEAEFDAELGGSSSTRSDFPHGGKILPLVSTDARYYTGATVTSLDQGFNEPIAISDNGYWLQSENSRSLEQTGFSQHYATLRSLSNYNLQHGTVSSEGYSLSSVSACHNMSKATKLFPISGYKVLVDGAGSDGNPETESTSGSQAKSIKFSISLSPITRDRTYLDVTDNMSEIGTTDYVDEDNVNLFETKKNRFKFNRIGIYAVRMDVKRFAANDTGTSACSADHVQFEIINDANPVLFAVADVNETVISDAGNGTGKIELDFVLNMDNESGETGLITDTGIYYNLYENSAITWYENQLLASAGLSEAVTSLGIDMANVKLQMQKVSGNSSSDSSETYSNAVDMTQYAKVNHTHAFMKNLVDGKNNRGGVAGIDAVADGSTVDGSVYNLGAYSLSLGSNTMASGEYCLVHGSNAVSTGDSSIIFGADSSINAGTGNAIIGSSKPTSIKSTSSYNTVTAMPNGGVALSSASGNLIFGLSVSNMSSEEEGQYSISNTSSSLIFGTLSATHSTMIGISRSIVGLSVPNYLDATSNGMVRYVSDSLILGSQYCTRNVSDTVMLAGSRYNGTTESSVIAGRSFNHSVQYQEKYECPTSDESGEYIVTGVTDAAAYGTTGTITRSSNSNLWVGDGDVYGLIQASLIAGSGVTIGKWSLINYDSVSNHARVTRKSSGMTIGLVSTGNNEIGYGASYSIVMGSGNSAGNMNSSILMGTENGTVVDGLEEYYSAEDYMTAHPSTVKPGSAFIAWLYSAEGGEEIRFNGLGDSYITAKGTNAIRYDGSTWFVCTDGELPTHYPTTTIADNEYGFRKSLVESGFQDGTKYNVMLGSGIKYGTNTIQSIVLGTGIDSRYATLRKSVIIGDSITLPSPSSINASSYVVKRFDNVLAFSPDAMVAGAMAKFADRIEQTYSDAMLFVSGVGDADTMAMVMGTANAYNASITYYSGKHNVVPGIAWSLDDDDNWVHKWYDINDSEAHDLTDRVDAAGSSIAYAQAKPSTSIIYTNGIALCGTDKCSSGGLLKLGSTFAPVAYIETNTQDIIGTKSGWSTSGWDSSFVGMKRGDIFDVMLVTGTERCPYAGRTLVVDHTQERDGTLHVKLGNYAAEPSLVMELAHGVGVSLSRVASAATATKISTSGKVYTTLTGTGAYIGQANAEGITARIYIGAVSGASDSFAAISGSSLKMMASSLTVEKWYRITSVKSTAVTDYTGTLDYLWVIESI